MPDDNRDKTPIEESREQRTKRILTDPNCMERIFAHVANGGGATTLAKNWDIRFSDMMAFIYADDVRTKRYKQAMEARVEWSTEEILNELRSIAHFDPRKLLNDDGTIKKVSEWPDEVVSAVAGLDISDVKADGCVIGTIKKLKITDRLKAVELIGKNLGTFTEKHVHSVDKTLEDILAASWVAPKDKK